MFYEIGATVFVSLRSNPTVGLKEGTELGDIEGTSDGTSDMSKIH